MFANLLYLEVIIIFIVDLSGFPDFLKKMVGRMLGVKVERMKPFDCSLCSFWWCGLIYLLITGAFTMKGVALVAVMAFLSEPLKNLLLLLSDIVTKVILCVNKILKLW